jgi:hypothetical protein
VIAEMILAYLGSHRIYEAKQRHIYERGYMPRCDADVLIKDGWMEDVMR